MQRVADGHVSNAQNNTTNKALYLALIKHRLSFLVALTIRSKLVELRQRHPTMKRTHEQKAGGVQRHHLAQKLRFSGPTSSNNSLRGSVRALPGVWQVTERQATAQAGASERCSVCTALACS